MPVMYEAEALYNGSGSGLGPAVPDTDYPFVDVINIDPLDANVDGQGGTIHDKPVWTLDQIVANLNRTSYPGTDIGGPGWNQGEYGAPTNTGTDTILFGFHNADTIAAFPYIYEQDGVLYGRREFFGFQEFSAAQKDVGRNAAALWDDLIAYSLQETTADKADITFGNYTNQPGTQAYAYLPYDYGGNSAGLQGDIWINGNQASNLQLNNGQYGVTTQQHEFGHAIGLQHPGKYNASPGVSITYENAAEYYQDTRQYTIMSYFGAEKSGAAHVDWNTLTFVYAATPLLHDVAAIQAIYGADPTTRTGNTTYGFNSTAGKSAFDFSQTPLPVITIYDAGGNDTLDLSGYNTPSTIDLTPGAFSSAGGSGVVPLETLKARGILPASYTQAQYDALRARYNSPDGLLHDNISIAYGTIIENAIGGGGNDTIRGNSANNVLKGNGGVDTISGFDGNDTLYGGDGNDTLYGGNDDDTLFGDAGNDVLYGDDGNDKLYGGADDDALYGGNGADTLFGDDGNDKLYGGDGFDVLHGGNGADTLYGGAGNDVLYGDDGYDRLFGGDDYDTLYGGNGNDVLFGEDGNDTLYGGNDYDVLIGGNGNDKLYGEAGNDTLWGGAGDDDLYGGSGLDRFLFNSTSTNGVDTIHGFKAEDKLVFFTDDGYAADAGFTAGTSAVGAGAQFVYDAGTGALYYDADGAGGAAAVKLATILDGTVHAGDILITAGSAPAF